MKADFEIALQLATELDFLFDNGNFEERRLLCETVFKRIYVSEDKIGKVELNAPFGLIATTAWVRELSRVVGSAGFEPATNRL